MRVLVTGATGFVGRSACEYVMRKGFEVVAFVRKQSSRLQSVECICVRDIGSCTDWMNAFRRVDAVVQLAAYVHVLRVSTMPTEFVRVNTEGTIKLARNAALAGVKRFVFVSSVKVHGKTSSKPLTEQDTPNRVNPDGRAKEKVRLKRLLDLALVIVLSPLLAVVVSVIAVAVKISSPGPVLHWSERIGRGNSTFWMPKFRTMVECAPQLATHLLPHPNPYLTRIGDFLRRTSLDELPQIFTVLTGKLSLVGPRPALFNQYDLIELRTSKEIHNLVPGITGWAQINGRDNLSTLNKVLFDEQYLRRRSLAFDMRILWLTLKKVVKQEDVAY